MPRSPRFAPAGYPFHVTNRGNDRRQIFFTDEDYADFLQLLTRGKNHASVKVFAVCPMPNHFHAIVQPQAAGALSAYFQWVSGKCATRYRSQTGTVGFGHVFQNRFWNDGIEDDRHFLSVLRYVEANPVAANLVARAEDWPWSSLSLRQRGAGQLLDPLPLELPDDWAALVNREQPCDEVTMIEQPAGPRGRPAPPRS